MSRNSDAVKRQIDAICAPTDPEQGWREVTEGEYGRAAGNDQDRAQVVTDRKRHFWVREAPVPPLPTEPYTIIRATFPDGLDYDLILRDQGWEYVTGNMPRTDMIRGITRFEVLAESVKPVAVCEGPDGKYRSVTADAAFRDGVKAVLDYLMALPDYYGATRVAREFKVDQ